MTRTVTVKRISVWEHEHTFTDVPEDTTDDDIERMGDELPENEWRDLGGDISYEVTADSNAKWE